MAAENILIVDDEPGVRAALRAILEDEGYRVTTAASGEEGVEKARLESFDAVLLDVWLPGIDGLDALARLRENRTGAEVVMISGHGTIETAVKATRLGAFDFIEKPLSLDKTLLVLRNALRQRRLERRNRRLLEQLARDTELVGDSAPAERLRAAVDAAAATDAPVLICGENGTGRETVARRVHREGARVDHPFATFSCRAVDAATASETLFGADGGGGRLRLAGGGTLFLEDVDALDPAMQSRFAARFAAAEAPDVRLVASGPPEAAGLHPEFRNLLDVVRIDVPALRERRDDVPILAERFMRDLAQEYGRPAKRFEAQALAALVRHDWPGNVRELRNVVERALLMAPAEVVRVADLPPRLGGAEGPQEDLYRDFGSLAEGLAAFERYYLGRIVVRSKGDLAVAGRLAGMDPESLRARLRDLGLG